MGRQKPDMSCFTEILISVRETQEKDLKKSLVCFKGQVIQFKDSGLMNSCVLIYVVAI